MFYVIISKKDPILLRHENPMKGCDLGFYSKFQEEEKMRQEVMTRIENVMSELHALRGHL